MLTAHGAGGMNGCAVLQEYQPPAAAVEEGLGPHLVMLSARTGDQLRASAARLEHLVRSCPGISLRDIAYTLRSRRAAMEWRLAIVASSVEQLVDELAQFGRLNPDAPQRDWLDDSPAEEGGTPHVYYGCASRGRAGLTRFLDARTADQIVLRHAQQGDLARLAFFWVRGWAIPAHVLDERSGGQVLSLPTYPFERTLFRTQAESLLRQPSTSIEFSGSVLQ